jgi:hypothetical protein
MKIVIYIIIIFLFNFKYSKSKDSIDSTSKISFIGKDSIQFTKSSNWEYGIALGHPSVLNLDIGYNWKKIKGRMSLGSFSTILFARPISGIQLSMAYEIYKNQNTKMYLTLPIGLTFIDDGFSLPNKYLYSGLTLLINSKNWEVGLGYVYSNFYRGDDYNKFRDRQMPYIHIGYIIQK